MSTIKAVWQSYIVNPSTQQVVNGAEIRVFEADGGAPATLYADRDGNSTIANPTFTLSDGFVRFYVDAGRYHIEAHNTSGQFSRFENVLIGELDEGAVDGDSISDNVIVRRHTSAQVVTKVGGVAGLKLLDDRQTGESVFVDDRNALFVWDGTPRNAEVTADPNEVQWIAPDDDATGASGAWRIARVTHVDTIEELRALTDLVDGQVVNVAGHTVAGKGGGLFRVTGDEAGETDNNGTLLIVDGKLVERATFGSINTLMFGAIADGVTDDTVAINAAIQACDGECWLLGPHRHTATITVPANVTLKGRNPEEDKLIADGSGYDAVDLSGSYASTYGVGFTSALERDSGDTVKIGGAYRGNNIENFRIQNAFNGIHISGEAVVTNIRQGEILDCKDGQGTGILIAGGNDTFIDKVVMDSTGTEPFAGIRIKKSQAVWVTDTDVIDFGIPLLIDPDGNNSEFVTWCFFNGLALDTSDGNGIEVTPSNGASVNGLFFDNCWSSTNNRGVLIQPVTGGMVDGVFFTDCTMYNNQLQGSIVNDTDGTVVNIEWNSCRIGGNSQASFGTYEGIGLSNGLEHFAIRDCKIGEQAGFGVTQSYAVLIGIGSDNYIVTGNDFTGNSSGTYADFSLATAQNKVVVDNLGFRTRNRGVESLTSTTSLVVNHGLGTTPVSVLVSPSNTNMGGLDLWAGSFTTTTFTINTSGNFTGDIAWQAEV